MRRTTDSTVFKTNATTVDTDRKRRSRLSRGCLPCPLFGFSVLCGEPFVDRCHVEYTFVYAAIHLHHEGSREGPSARRQSARRHLAVLLFRREDRRVGIERRGQELAVADHGGRGYELHRRSICCRGHISRLPATGTETRSDQERARQRRGGRS